MGDGKSRAAALTELSVLLAAIFWGLNFAATKYATAFVPPLLIVALRFTVGGLLLYGILRLLEPGERPGRRDLLHMAALGCFGVVVAQTGFTFGLSLTTAASTGLVFATAPVWGLILSAVLGQERPTRRGVLGVALSIVGVAVVFSEGLLTEGGGSIAGNLWVLLAAVCVGAYSVFSVPLLERHSPLAVATYPLLFGGALVLILSAPQMLTLDWTSLGLGVWAVLAYAAIFSTAFAFAGWQRGISRVGANRTLIYQYVITLVGVGSGVVFFGEALGPSKLIGGAVILIGVYLARRPPTPA